MWRLCAAVMGSTFVNYLIERLRPAQQELQTHVIDPGAMNYQKLAPSISVLKAQIIQTRDFVNAVNDLLKKYIDPIHKRQKKPFRKCKRDPNVIKSGARKTNQDSLKR